MVTFSNVRNANPAEYDACWIIMRSDKYMRPGTLHVPQLSPNWDLFNLYMQLKKAGVWDRDAFEGTYVPRFLKQLKLDPAKSYLNKLFYWSREGKNIQCCCSCDEEDMCHRSIVGGVLEGVGCAVQYEVGSSYLQYSKQFKDLH